MRETKEIYSKGEEEGRINKHIHPLRRNYQELVIIILIIVKKYQHGYSDSHAHDNGNGNGGEEINSPSLIIINEEAFPALGLLESSKRDEEKDLKEIENHEGNVDHPKNHKCVSVDLWADVAHTGHKNSVAQQIQYQKRM